MALRKTKTFLNSGVSGNYWKITKSLPDYMTKNVCYILELFVNSAYKNGSSIKEEGAKKVFNFILTSEEINGDLRAVVTVK